MGELPKFSSFQEFYPYYLKEHAHPGTRFVHAWGTLLGVSVGTYQFFAGRFLLIPLTVLSTYLVLWASHTAFMGNRPATLHWPWWSFLSDFKMNYEYFSRLLRLKK